MKTNFKIKENFFRCEYSEILNKYFKWINLKSFKLKKKRKSVQCFHIKNNNSKNISNIILFSQSQKSNFGTILPFLLDLSSFFKTSIITYEYSNCSNETKVIEDCQLVYDYLSALDSINTISMIGISVGSFANFSALNRTNQKVMDIVAISPTWVFSPTSLKTSSNESNQNKKKINETFEIINQLEIPVFIIHGKEDKYVKYLLSLSLTRRIKKIMEWYPKKGKHLNIITTYRSKLYSKMMNFYLGFYGKNSIKGKNFSYLSNDTSFNKFSHNNNLSTFSTFEGHFGQFKNENVQITDKNINTQIVDETPMFERKTIQKNKEPLIEDNLLTTKNQKLSSLKSSSNSSKDHQVDELYGTFMPGDILPSFTNINSTSLIKSSVNGGNNNAFTFVDEEHKEHINQSLKSSSNIIDNVNKDNINSNNIIKIAV